MGNRIRALREAEGLTQEELASAMGVTRAAVSMWESGLTQNIRPQHLLLLAKFFGVTPQFLVNGEV
jgi:transcriptional regulator with XRE-family HTH domain